MSTIDTANLVPVPRATARRGVVIALALAAIGAVGTIASAAADPRRAVLGWIAAYGFGVSTVMSALVLVMAFRLAGARWWFVVQPVFDAVTSTIPMYAVLFVPIAGGLRFAYPWMNSPAGLDAATESALEHQRAWNSPRFFLARAIVYLLSWIVLARLVRSGDDRRRRAVSGGGLVVIAFTLSYAAFDWLMSLEPGWVSNMFGLYVFTGGLVGAISVVAVAAWAASRRGLLVVGAAFGPAHAHALGRLLLMSVILWGYIGYFQLLLVWIANIPREVTFFAARSKGSFGAIDAVLVVGHFAVPLLVLLSRPLKRSPGTLAVVGAWLLVMHAVDMAWIVLGARATRDLTFGLRDLAPFVVVGGVTWALGASRLLARREARVSAADAPSLRALQEALRYRSP